MLGYQVVLVCCDRVSKTECAEIFVGEVEWVVFGQVGDGLEEFQNCEDAGAGYRRVCDTLVQGERSIVTGMSVLKAPCKWNLEKASEMQGRVPRHVIARASFERVRCRL